MQLKKSGLAAICALLLACCIGCGNNVQGNTYADANGMMKIQFQSGGKALVTIGFTTQNCEWTQSSSNVSVKCDNDTLPFTLNSDGSLAGPAGGAIGPLTKVKQ